MERRQLESFLAVAEAGSFTRASSRLSSPSRGVGLTAAGEALVAPAQRTVRSFSLASGAVRAQHPAGHRDVLAQVEKSVSTRARSTSATNSPAAAPTRFETRHPVVRVHPETGERSLVLGHFVKTFEGLNTSESTALFQLLQNRITKLENTIRWTWEQGDVAMWDNRATQHYAVADFGSEPAEMRRITVAGDVPVALDGRRSEILHGDADAYSRLDELIS